MTQATIQIVKHKPLAQRMIEDVVQHGLCTGCGLCTALAPHGSIGMQISSEGYLRPVVLGDVTEVKTAVLRDTCPGLHVGHDEDKLPAHPIWGPVVTSHAGFATDDEIRRMGSSGGVITALGNWLLATGKVAFVAQIAVSHRDPLRNELQISRTREDVIRAAGSRYAPSAPLSELASLLDGEAPFAFVGKPCDIAALRRYARHDDRVNRLIPYMFSFMCAGMPSIHGTHALLDKLGADRKRLSSFRYRGDGWPGMARAVTDDGQVFETDYNSSWGQVLGNYLQFRCKICADGTGEFADVTCADAWYGKDGYPDFTERDGRSLVLGRSQRGATLVSDAVRAGVLQLKSLPIEEVAQMQPYQVTRKKVVLGRAIATRLARGHSPRYRNMGLLRASLMANPIEWLRHAWGTYRRAKGERP